MQLFVYSLRKIESTIEPPYEPKTPNMNKLVSTGFLLVFLSVSLCAQKAPMKFGKVSQEEVAMTVYEPDSTVDAIVLCEYGYFNPRDLRFHYTIRYKIITKEGLNSLIMSLPVSSKSDVRGMVYNMVDGSVVESKMKKESIYQERVIGSYSRIRIAPPDAREGSVIDINYSMPGLPREWNFQKMIPVLWSELVIPSNEYITFSKRFIGYEPLYKTDHYRWVAKDMPAFLPEPYISSRNNYMTTMFLEISQVHINGGHNGSGVFEDYGSTWNAVAKYYDEHTSYGDILRASASYLKDAAEEIHAASEGEKELVFNALDRIQAEVKWSKVNDFYPANSLRDVYVKDKTGTSADMNVLFLKLLQKLDIECYPLLMSTRSEGYINPMFPTRSRFNYTSCYVSIDGEFHVIDASDKYYGPELLKPACLNGAGFVLRQGKGGWVDIAPDKMSRRMVNCMLSVGEDGMVEGTMQVQHGDYAAASYRKNREDFNTEDEYLEEFEQDHPGIFVMDYQVQNLDKDRGSIAETFEVEIDGNTNVGGGLIHIDPVMIDRLEENPFKLETRECPVDFAYGRNSMYVLTLIIPDGFVAEQLPAPIKLVTADKSGIFQCNVVQSGNSLQLMYKMTIKKPVFMQAEYEELRGFYNLIVNKESEPIILKRANP